LVNGLNTQAGYNAVIEIHFFIIQNAASFEDVEVIYEIG